MTENEIKSKLEVLKEWVGDSSLTRKDMQNAIDEAIKHAREVAEKKYTEGMLCHANPNDDLLEGCIQCAEEHEQLAEWLEDYKRVKKWKDEIMEEFCRYDASSIEELMQRARNKAIDDFAKLSKEKWIEHDDLGLSSDFFDYMDEIAEQLKDGGTDA